ncbi:MAG: hypothetical protein AAGD07_02195 [Planctomycetota bacterium]
MAVPAFAHAQFRLPVETSSQTNPLVAAPAATPLEPTAHLNHAQAALAGGDVKTAVLAYRQARQALLATGVKAPAATATALNKLKAQLVAVGIDAKLLETATTPTRDRRSEALRLTALGRAALERGETSTALSLANQAAGMNVPEKEFQPGDARPWQLLLDAQAAAKRRGLAPTPFPSPATGVVQAGGMMESGEGLNTMFPNGGQPIAQAGGVMPANMPGSIAQVQAVTASESASEGADLFQKGMDALTAGKQTEARQFFIDAWKYEAELDPTTRRALQDKLTLMQPSRLPKASEALNPENMTAIERAQMEQSQKTRRLYREVTAELASAADKKTSAPLDAVDDLERLMRRVQGSDVDDATKAQLAAMVSRALKDQNAYVEANRAEIDLELKNDAIRMEMDVEAVREMKIDDEISALVETFNDLMDEKRFEEAQVVAKQVSELKPDSAIASSMAFASRMQIRLQLNEEIMNLKEEGFNYQMLDIERSMIAPNTTNPIDYGDNKTWQALSERRLAESSLDSRLSPREQEIKRRLKSESVRVSFQNKPLGEVLDDLSRLTGVPMVIDRRALAAMGMTEDTPISKSITSEVSLRSALNIVLEDLDLAYVMENEVLTITSREAKRSKVIPVTYRVADLVTPIPNFISGYEDGLAGAMRAAHEMINPTTEVQVMPVSVTDLGGGLARSGGATSPNVLGQYGGLGPASGFRRGGLGGALAGGLGAGAMADFDSLMQLIQQTIEPETWQDLGGTSTMAPYQQNLSLVISTTSDVHDQIVDLLESLRRLQNLQITIEVRFITLSDSFFEQIGVDLDLQFDDDVTSLPAEDGGGEVTIGIDAQGLPTADLDIRFDNNSFGVSPPFGGFDAGAASSLGFAILSDIEAFFFLQAAQGDNRTNIMQAPKVTLFDGQFAFITDTTQRPFVTSIIPVVGDFAVAQQPVITVLDEGTKLNVQAVVTDDRRFVRLTLIPNFSQIGEVQTFTFQGNRTTRSSSTDQEDTNGDGVIDEEDETESEDIIQGTTVQQPVFAQTSVSTTVSVPDGGTILLGGIKRMSEGRVERGVPFLSKIPYVSRLFRNVGVGRDARSLMLMVTPRIIIQEEEEVAQTGFNPNR